MTIDIAQPQASYDEWRTRRWRLTGGLVVLLWVAFTVMWFVLGEPDLRTARGPASSFGDLWGRELPGWVAWWGIVAWASTWLLVIGGPQPWRATRWAWVWLVSIGAPVGMLGYLLLGGPLGFWRPADLNRRLTGGWAFLLAMVLLGGSSAT